MSEAAGLLLTEASGSPSWDAQPAGVGALSQTRPPAEGLPAWGQGGLERFSSLCSRGREHPPLGEHRGPRFSGSPGEPTCLDGRSRSGRTIDQRRVVIYQSPFLSTFPRLSLLFSRWWKWPFSMHSTRWDQKPAEATADGPCETHP